MREDVEFNANGTTLRGWFYRPQSNVTRHPTVILAHGFSALKEMGLDQYATVFADAGLACLVYDNRNLGASDGQPRDEIDPVAQMRDYRHAVSYAQSRADVDSKRIGIWGTSYTGGLVIIAAATDPRVMCVVSQVPSIHGLENAKLANTSEAMDRRWQAINKERARLSAGQPPTRVTVCEYDQSQDAMSPNNRTFDFFHAFDGTGESKWPNRVTVRSQELKLDYDALGFAARVAPTPLLMIVATDDVITPTEIALQAFDSAGEPKKLHLIEGDHYRPYLEAFDESSATARDWFVEHLMPRKSEV